MLEKLVMTVLIGVSVAAFARRISELVGYLRLGAADDRVPRDWLRKIKDQIVVVLGQRKLLQWSVPGAMHFFIFWGFVILFTTIIEGFGLIYADGFHLPLIGRWGPLGALQDFFIAAVLVGIATALAIRRLQNPGRFRGSHTREAEYILYAIAGIMITIMFTRGAEIAVGDFPYDARWTPLSNLAAQTIEPFSVEVKDAIRTTFLWWHSLIILGFLVYLTYSKHLHIIT